MKKKVKPYLFGLLGACIVGFAVSILTKAGFGLDAFNSFIGNLVQLTGRSFGLFSLLIGICFVTINSFINKKRFNFLAIGIAYIIGFSVDIFIPLIVGEVEVSSLLLRIVWFIVGVLIYGFGVALLIKSNILSPLEEYMMAIKRIFHTSVAKSKFISDTSLMLFALVVGFIGLNSFGQVGIGTIIITVFMGKVIALFLIFLNKVDRK